MTGKFVRGYIDGSLSTLGILVGASSASAPVIVAAAVGGTLANGVSNLLSAYSAEGIELYKDLRRTENAMVAKELKGSLPERRVSRLTVRMGLVDGLATIIGGGILVLPYLFLPSFQAMLVAVGLVLVSISSIGVYLGKLSKRNMLLSAIKMALYCIVVAGLVYLIQMLIVSGQR
ncbi:TIGR00267 family protein [Candidatus Fermentibacteria bacterium]|nr:TIGR00267 family protein [Candidatus Fermentibacteria bacterium]